LNEAFTEIVDNNNNGMRVNSQKKCIDIVVARAGLTVVPVVPWEAPAARRPLSTAKFLPRCVDVCVGLKLNDNDHD